MDLVRLIPIWFFGSMVARFLLFLFDGICSMVATFPISCLMAAADFVSFSPFFFGAGDGGGGLGRSVH